MKLRGQFVLLSAIPLLGLALIFLIGIITLNELRTDISHLIHFQDERSMILNADRDAYQVQESEMKAIGAHSRDELSDLDEANKENLQQVWERITGPGENFTDNMSEQFERFKNEYAVWEMESRKGFETSLSIFDDRQAALSSSDKAEEAFGQMRDRIDWIGELIDTELSQELSFSRRRQLEQALSLVLNGDRDAYQAYVAQLKAFEARSLAELQDLDGSNLENIEQTGERVSRAASLMGGEALVFDQEFREYFETWKIESRNTLVLSLKIFDQMSNRDNHLATSEARFSEMRDSIDKLGEMQDERSQAEADKMETQISQMIMQNLIVFIASLLIALAFSLLISNSLLRSIRTNITLANSISQGKLDVNVLNSSRKDEMGELNNVLADMKERLRSTILSVKNSAAYVTSGSRQLSESAQGLSAGASEQASSTEQVSASIEQMSSSIDQNTENAQQTRSISEGVSRRATESGDAVKQTVEAMNEISQKINIVSEMARQTNLLALNAAIEAARAGDAGKGFAVVASEVRKLAENSQKSAVGITDLSEKSFDVAEKAGSMIVGLVEDIQKTSDLVQEISASSTEQSHGMTQVSSAILQLDKVTQSNASASEEIASTAEELAAQAQSLNDEMDFFTV